MLYVLECFDREMQSALNRHLEVASSTWGQRLKRLHREGDNRGVSVDKGKIMEAVCHPTVCGPFSLQGCFKQRSGENTALTAV